MSKPGRKKKAPPRDAEPPSRFAPSAFLSGSPEAVRLLCDELASEAAKRFADLTGTTWTDVGKSIVAQLRRSGHDLCSFEDTDELQEWQATWHHPRGTFSLLLAFRAPASVEVTWKTEQTTFSSKA